MPAKRRWRWPRNSSMPTAPAALFRLETLDFAGARADSEQALALAPGDSAVQSLYGVQNRSLRQDPPSKSRR